MSEDSPITVDPIRVKILQDVMTERIRQDCLKAAGKFTYTCADPELLPFEKYAVLVEEVGEVARALLNQARFTKDTRPSGVREELIQVMVVCLAWLEALDDVKRHHLMASDSTVEERKAVVSN